MVQSGLINDITVSHYRLSVHLGIAFLIITSIFWLILNFSKQKNKIFFSFSKKNLPFLILIFLIFLQIILGAFVSGLDAGQIYQTWPLMNYTYFPDDVSINNIKDIINFNNHALVQFYHRNLAYLISFYILALGFFIYSKELKRLYNPFKSVIFILSLQVFLGIYTLISQLNIYLASAHQITSVLLVFTAINLYYYEAK